MTHYAIYTINFWKQDAKCVGRGDCTRNAGAGDKAGNRTDEQPILRRLFYENGSK